MKMNRVEAYTLSELLIVLIISSIVISLTFTVLNLVQKQIKGIQLNFKNQQEIQSLERALWNDFNQYTVEYISKNNQLKCINQKDTIFYRFFNNVILREKDSFFTKLTNKELFLDGITVKDGFIDAILLETQQSFASKKVFVYKQKDASYYVNK